MAESTIREELRKYSALAWTLVITLIVSVSLFVQFVRMDRSLSIDAFSVDAKHAATISGIRIAQLIERLEMMGREHLIMQASDSQLLNLMRALDVDKILESLCASESGTVRIIHSPDEASTSARNRCTVPFPPPLTTVPNNKLTGFGTDLRVVESLSGEGTLLEIRMFRGADELRATIRSAVLLGNLLANDIELSVDIESVCLSLQVDGDFHELTCHTGDTFAAIPEAFSTMAGNQGKMIEELVTSGLSWRITISPNLQSLAGTITMLPLMMFGAALAIGAAACVFTYRATDKNIRIEAHSHELRRRLEQVEQLEQQNNLLDQFAAMAAHDLQAPLRFIVSNAHLLVADLEELDQPELTRMALVQVEQGERMRELVLDLLDFCRAGQSKLVMSPVDVGLLVNEEVRLIKAHEEFSTTRIVVGALPKVLVCDAKKLAHIVRNLLGNAVKFSQESSAPKVSISASRNELHGPWTFRVRDNGPGVKKDYHEFIFRPFARLDSNTKGTGMGLAIVKIMLERHGGIIYIDPDETDGSTFCFTMPGAMPERTP